MVISAKNTFLSGVVEGFYGRPWSFETRLAYATYLVRMGLNTYLYCPKADPYLRKRWHHRWPDREFRRLRVLADTYREHSLVFAVGLSPFALYQNYGAKQRALLRTKVEELNALESPVIALLFDDMPGEMSDLAARQCEIVADLQSWTTASRILVCPTYYSFDPVLETVFGPRPEGYWQQLGQALPADIDVFWTGNKVCSNTINISDIERIQHELGRPVMLWDNYPVNDSALRSNYLYVDKLGDREPGLGKLLSGHLCNPMNQGVVSLMALQGLAQLYGVQGVGDTLLRDVWGAEGYGQLIADLDNFQCLGLSGMGSSRCRALARAYGKIGGPAALEVAQWLRGEYTFDPACLTD